ncbi:hypothetical protein AB9Q10_11230 [Streptomyces krungchingensis]|uniref:hypothetical protein n=1 Tax=Streptomyces krungchingensis TaxID=1565034 RepID=UPI003CEF80BA
MGDVARTGAGGAEAGGAEVTDADGTGATEAGAARVKASGAGVTGLEGTRAEAGPVGVGAAAAGHVGVGAAEAGHGGTGAGGAAAGHEGAGGAAAGHEGGARGRPARVEVVELLVPGLGPVDRERLIRPPATVGRVSGDEKAGLYRTVVDLNKAPHKVVREVYDWTRLTIGGASRALWLFLMPFLLINLVAWMQPRWPCGKDKRWRKLAGGVYEFGARLLALSLTVLVVGTVGQLAMDQFAWQCSPQAGQDVCADDNPAVRILRSWDTAGPQWGFVVAALAPALVVFVLLLAARDTKQEYLPVLETVSEEEAERARLQRAGKGEDGHPLELPGFWEHNRRDPGMAAQHVWAGLLTTAGLLTWTPLHQDLRGNGPEGLGRALFAVILFMTLVLLISVPWVHRKTCLPLPPSSLRSRLLERIPLVRGKIGERRGGGRYFPLWPTHYPIVAGVLCACVNVAAVLYCLVPDRRWTVDRVLPGMQVQSTVLLLVQAFGVCLLTLASVVLPVAGTRRGMALLGLGGPAMAVLACFVAWLYTTASSQWTGSWLARPGRRTDVPQPVDVMGMVLAPVLVLSAVCGAVVFALVWFVHVAGPAAPGPGGRPGPGLVKRFVRAYQADSREERDDRRHLHELRAARRKHTYLLREADWMMGTAAVLVVAVTGAFYFPLGIRPGLRDARDLAAGALGSLSIPLLAGLAALMLLAFRTLAIRSDMRQNAGLAWAFGAFWPRAAHPFAPPSWTVRAVPELVHRLHVLLKDERGRVLVRANSMGTVLVMAAVWQLDAALRARIALITTGCPVGMFFSRNYPAFVCVESIDALGPRGERPGLAGWINVWRDTDPLGGPVGIEDVDVRWADDAEGADGGPGAYRRTREAPVFPPIEGHRGYTGDSRLMPLRNRLLAELVASNPPEPPTGPEPTAPPERAGSPGPTRTPEPTRTPGPTGTPEPAGAPERAGSPGPTRTPEPTGTPGPTRTPEPAGAPEAIEPHVSARAGEAINSPEATDSAEATDSPEATDSAEAINSPEATDSADAYGTSGASGPTGPAGSIGPDAPAPVAHVNPSVVPGPGRGEAAPAPGRGT